MASPTAVSQLVFALASVSGFDTSIEETNGDKSGTLTLIAALASGESNRNAERKDVTAPSRLVAPLVSRSLIDTSIEETNGDKSGTPTLIAALASGESNRNAKRKDIPAPSRLVAPLVSSSFTSQGAHVTVSPLQQALRGRKNFVATELTNQGSTINMQGAQKCDKLIHDQIGSLPGFFNKERFQPHQVSAWNRHLDEVKVFKKQHGHCAIPHEYPPNKALGRWAKRQRYNYRKFLREELLDLKLTITGKHPKRASSLTKQRINALNEIGFCWEHHRSIWNLRYEQLKAFKKAQGHTLVPYGWKANPALSVWVKTQRRLFRLKQLGKCNAILPDRIAKLDAIDFTWRIKEQL